MLKTNLDFEVLKDFLLSEPKSMATCDPHESLRWLKYWSYIKSGSDLVLKNFDTTTSNIITTLTTGRGESKISFEEKTKPFHKNEIPKGHSARETFFLNEPNEESQKRFRDKNPFYFGFISDHFEAFERLSLIGKQTTFPVRKNKESNKFESWNLLKEYLLPFSDCIIIDNYLFSESELIWEQNLEQILVQLSKSTPIRFNLLIITYKGDRVGIDIQKISKYLQVVKEKYALKANISVIATSKIEHDRNIFMNYLRIKSGTSLNYFNSKGQPIVNSEIEFLTYTDKEYFNNANIILKDVSKYVDEVIKKGNQFEFSGDCKNRLLSQEY